MPPCSTPGGRLFLHSDLAAHIPDQARWHPGQRHHNHRATCVDRNVRESLSRTHDATTSTLPSPTTRIPPRSPRSPPVRDIAPQGSVISLEASKQYLNEPAEKTRILNGIEHG